MMMWIWSFCLSFSLSSSLLFAQQPCDYSQQDYEAYHELERLYRAWEFHVSRAEYNNRIGRKNYASMQHQIDNREYWKKKRDEFAREHGGKAFLACYRQSKLYRRTYLNRPTAGFLPDRSSSPLYSSDRLEPLLEVDYPRDHISVAPDGNIYFDRFFSSPDDQIKVEVFDPSTGQVKVFPSQETLGALADQGIRMYHIHAIRVDSQNRIWILDSGGALDALSRDHPQIFAFTSEGELFHHFEFSDEVVPANSMLNDFTHDEENGVLYISDSSPGPFNKRPAIVVYDWHYGSEVRVLENHPSVRAHSFLTRLDSMGGRIWRLIGGFYTPRISVDGIVYDSNRDYLYFSPNNGGRVFGIDAKHLREAVWTKMDVKELDDHVDLVGETTMTDGMNIDEQGRIYLTDPEHSAIVRLEPRTGSLETLIKDPKLIQLISNMEFGPDGALYFWTFPFHELMQAKFNVFADFEKKVAKRSYYLYRLPLDSASEE